jgi:hypothetical protein
MYERIFFGSRISILIYIYYLVTGLVPEELLPLLLKEAAVENAEEGRKFFFLSLVREIVL